MVVQDAHALSYLHVDVFTPDPFGGNSLAVFSGGLDLPTDCLLTMTQELRHFESVFVDETTDMERPVRTRVLDLFDELPFAGHPLLGAAAALHHREGGARRHVTLAMGSRMLELDSRRTSRGFVVGLDQGRPDVGAPCPRDLGPDVARAFGLPRRAVAEDGMRVASTGLRYLVVPVTSDGLAAARPTEDLGAVAASAGAEYVVLLDRTALEMRHWTNDGRLEDAATGSAAGAVAAYAVRTGLASARAVLRLVQGRFVGRPSVLRTVTDDPADPDSHVLVEADVVVVGRGELRVP